ncbi:hypothetical protein F4W70_09170 [Pseudomonas cannabina]|nr:hypothetical protein F4W70_09170 [Pseudomonas cannabina]
MEWSLLGFSCSAAICLSREGLKKPFLQKSKPVNTGAPARFLSKKMGFFRGYLVVLAYLKANNL